MLIRRPTSTETERGASAVEYALLVAMVAAVVLAIIAVLGTKVIPLYNLTF